MEFYSSVRMKIVNGCIVIKPLRSEDLKLFQNLINEDKYSYYDCKFQTPVDVKHFKQVKTVFKIIELIFISENGRKPTKEEKQEFYEYLLEEYAPKRINEQTEELETVTLSNMTVSECAFFIEGLIIHLSTYCSLPLSAQTEVKQLIQNWYSYYGYVSIDNIENCTMEEYRERHPTSEASGEGGDLHLHHIITKGSDTRLRDCTANWIMLTVKEHRDLHDYGEEVFLRKYPHLINKFKRIQDYQKEINNNGRIRKM